MRATAAPPALAADLEAGLKRLKPATVRRRAPEILQTATTVPAAKTFDGFDIAASSIPPATIDYLAGLESTDGQTSGGQ